MKKSILRIIFAVTLILAMLCESLPTFAVGESAGISPGEAYYIKSMVTNKYLSAVGDYNSGTRQTFTKEFSGGDNQIWVVTLLPNGYYSLRSASGIEAYLADSYSGADVSVRGISNKVDYGYHWQIKRNQDSSTEGAYYLTSRSSDDTMYLHEDKDSFLVEQYGAKDEYTNWYFEKVPKIEKAPSIKKGNDGVASNVISSGEIYHIRSMATNKYLSAVTDDYAYTKEFYGDNDQIWTVTLLSNGYYSLRPVSDPEYYLNVNWDSKKANGAGVCVQSITGPSSEWQIKRNQDSSIEGAFYITSRSSDDTMYLHAKKDPFYEEQEDAFYVEQYDTPDESANWCFEKVLKVTKGDEEVVSNGICNNEAYYIKSVITKKYLSVYDSGNADGTKVITQAFTGADSQIWTVDLLSNGYYALKPKCAKGSYLALNPDAGKSGSNVEIWNSDTTKDRLQWKIIRNNNPDHNMDYSPDGSYCLTSHCSDDTMYLHEDVATFNVEQYDSCDEYANWCFEKVSKGDAGIISTNDAFIRDRKDTEFVRFANAMGYNGWERPSAQGSRVLKLMRNDDGLAHNGHGLPGSLKFELYTRYHEPYGSIVCKTEGSVITCSDIDKLQSNDLAGLRFFITTGCSSAQNDEDGKNIIDSIYNKGAQFAIGWTIDVDGGMASKWVWKFMEAAEAGYSVKKCMDFADCWINPGPKYYRGDINQILLR